MLPLMIPHPISVDTVVGIFSIFASQAKKYNESWPSHSFIQFLASVFVSKQIYLSKKKLREVNFLYQFFFIVFLRVSRGKSAKAVLDPNPCSFRQTLRDQSQQ